MSSFASGAFAPLKRPHAQSGFIVIPIIKELSICLYGGSVHATGKRTSAAMAKAALVAGVHGIMVEVHPDPEKALSDGPNR